MFLLIQINLSPLDDKYNQISTVHTQSQTQQPPITLPFASFKLRPPRSLTPINYPFPYSHQSQIISSHNSDMGSNPSSSTPPSKSSIHVIQINTPQKQRKQNQQFNNSIQNMKYAQRDDIFKQKSDQTKIELSIALLALKNNPLLSTGNFKKLHRTEVLAKPKNSRRSSILKNYEHLEHGKNIKKVSINPLVAKRQISSQSVSVSSFIYPSAEDQTVIKPYNIQNLEDKESSLGQHLKIRKKALKSPASNRHDKNLFDPEANQTIETTSMRYENGKSSNSRRKNKNIKSQKFIPGGLVVINEQNSSGTYINKNY